LSVFDERVNQTGLAEIYDAFYSVLLCFINKLILPEKPARDGQHYMLHLQMQADNL
jgi:hypothetical protein